MLLVNSFLLAYLEGNIFLAPLSHTHNHSIAASAKLVNNRELRSRDCNEMRCSCSIQNKISFYYSKTAIVGLLVDLERTGVVGVGRTL